VNDCIGAQSIQPDGFCDSGKPSRLANALSNDVYMIS
jgi:hypothetical protein